MRTTSSTDHGPAEFAVAPVDARLVWLLPGLAAVGVLIGALVLLPREPRVWPMLPVAFAVLALVAVLVRRRRVSIVDDTLVVVAGLNRHRIAITDLDLASARVVDLRERREWRPWIKVFGTRMPGLSMGHFRLRDRSRAFVLMTTTARVLVLDEKTSGRRLLLGLARPQALLDALQARSRNRT